MRDIRGKEISMIFQEPMTSLSPVHTIGDQIMENVLLHLPMDKEEARDRTVEELARVGIPNPGQRVDAYPFQLSGGMRQRAMIAMALSCNPSLLIADEPTTALDVTTQAQILELMRGLQDELGMAIMFITHDLGVVAEMADDVAVMYLGIVAERGDVDSIFHDPKHPYTRALLRSIPRMGRSKANQRLDSIRGMVPHPYNRPTGLPLPHPLRRDHRGLLRRDPAAAHTPHPLGRAHRQRPASYQASSGGASEGHQGGPVSALRRKGGEQGWRLKARSATGPEATPPRGQTPQDALPHKAGLLRPDRGARQGGGRRRLEDPARRDPRARRGERLRQDHPGPLHREVLRAHRGRDGLPQ